MSPDHVLQSPVRADWLDGLWRDDLEKGKEGMGNDGVFVIQS